MKIRLLFLALMTCIINIYAFSQIIKKNDLKLKNVDRRAIYGSISGNVVNPFYNGKEHVNIKTDYNLALYEVQNAAMPANSLFANTKVTIVQNISTAVVTFKNSPLDTLEFTITNLPLNKKLILVWYNKNLNVDEYDIKAIEKKYIVHNAYFQKSRNIKWASDVEYPNNYVFTCTSAKPEIENLEISILENTITLPK